MFADNFANDKKEAKDLETLLFDKNIDRYSDIVPYEFNSILKKDKINYNASWIYLKDKHKIPQFIAC